MMRGRWRLWGLIVLGLAAVGVWYNISGKNDLDLNVDNWPVYVSADGYSFKYPPTMNLVPDGQELLGYFESYGGPQVFVYDSEFLKIPRNDEDSFSSWYEKYDQKRRHDLAVGGDKVEDFNGPIQIGENKYLISFKAIIGNFKQSTTIVFLDGESQVMVFIYHQLSPNDALGNINKWEYAKKVNEHQKTFAQMMQTLIWSTGAKIGSNVYVSETVSGQRLVVSIPSGWVANKFNPNVGDYPLSEKLGVEFYPPEKKEWSWSDDGPATRIWVAFEESTYTGPVDNHPEVEGNSKVQMWTNTYGVRFANLTDGRVLVNFPGENICTIRLEGKTAETAEILNDFINSFRIENG